jgi:hypothetical protein
VFQCKLKRGKAEVNDNKVVRKYSLSEARREAATTAPDVATPKSPKTYKCPKTYTGPHDGVCWWGSDNDTNPGATEARTRELAEFWPKIFSQLDTNGDGTVLADEIEAAASKL